MGGRRHGGANCSHMQELCIISCQQCRSIVSLLLLANKCIFHVQLTYVDFSLYEILDHHRVFEPALLEGYPVLKVSLSLVLLVCSRSFNFATFAAMQEYLDRFEASAECREVVVCGCAAQCLACAVKSLFLDFCV